MGLVNFHGVDENLPCHNPEEDHDNKMGEVSVEAFCRAVGNFSDRMSTTM